MLQFKNSDRVVAIFEVMGGALVAAGSTSGSAGMQWIGVGLMVVGGVILAWEGFKRREGEGK